MGNKPNPEMFFVGHLDEVDDLEKYGRDAPLLDSEKNKKILSEASEAIIDRMKDANRKAVMFVTSPKLRAKETADLVAQEIKNKLGGDIKIRFSTNENLKSTEQGEFVLPEDYKPGTFSRELDLASKIFIMESLESPNPNLHYKFGDPIKRPDGSYKYPELAQYFTKTGESYAESLIRILTTVLEASRKTDKFNSSVEMVVVAHGFTYHILNGLTILGEQVKQGDVRLDVGELAPKLWEIYKNGRSEIKSAAYAPLDITNLDNEDLLELLRREIEYLKK